MTTGGRTQTYFALYEMLQDAPKHPATAQCPVCVLVLQSVDRYLMRMTAEGTASVPDRLAVRAAGGYCNKHAARWVALRENLPTALYYSEFIHELAGKLGQVGHAGGRRGGRLGGLFAGSADEAKTELDERQEWGIGLARCTACEVQRENEPRVVDDFLVGLSRDDFRAAYAASFGICVPHSIAALRQSLEPDARRAITETEAEHMRRLEADLRSVQDTYNAIEGQTKTFGDEIHALTRAIWKSAGVTGLR